MNKALKNFWWILSSIFYVLSFPPFYHWYFIFIAIAFYFYGLIYDEKNILKSYFLGFLVSLGGFYWVVHAVYKFGNLPYWQAILIFLAFCSFNQAQFFITAISWKILNKKANYNLIEKIIFLPAFFTLVDWFYPKIFRDHLGHSLSHSIILLQLSDISGVSLLSYLIALTSLLLFLYLKEKKTKYLIVFFIIISVWSAIGFTKYRHYKKLEKDSDNSFNFSGIQANIGEIDKFEIFSGVQDAQERVLEKYIYYTKKSLTEKKTNLIIWPETAFPTSFGIVKNRTQEFLQNKLINLQNTVRIPIIFGGYQDNGASDYNAVHALYFENSIQKTWSYQKTILLPFGETVPLIGENEWFKNKFPQMGFFKIGNGPEIKEIVIKNKKINITPIICYEILFPEYLRQSSILGSDVIVNVTNDSWFGNHAEPELHFALSIFRSIENRIPQIRLTNTGISGLINASGKISNLTEINNTEILNEKVFIIQKSSTLFKKHGDFFTILLTFLVLIFSYTKLVHKKSFFTK